MATVDGCVSLILAAAWSTTVFASGVRSALQGWKNVSMTTGIIGGSDGLCPAICILQPANASIRTTSPTLARAMRSPRRFVFIVRSNLPFYLRASSGNSDHFGADPPQTLLRVDIVCDGVGARRLLFDEVLARDARHFRRRGRMERGFGALRLAHDERLQQVPAEADDTALVADAAAHEARMQGVDRDSAPLEPARQREGEHDVAEL